MSPAQFLTEGQALRSDRDASRCSASPALCSSPAPESNRRQKPPEPRGLPLGWAQHLRSRWMKRWRILREQQTAGENNEYGGDSCAEGGLQHGCTSTACASLRSLTLGFRRGPTNAGGGESTRALTKVNCELFFVTNSGQQIRAKVRP
jgi:hypothetical protein